MVILMTLIEFIFLCLFTWNDMKSEINWMKSLDRFQLRKSSLIDCEWNSFKFAGYFLQYFGRMLPINLSKMLYDWGGHPIRPLSRNLNSRGRFGDTIMVVVKAKLVAISWHLTTKLKSFPKFTRHEKNAA